MSAHVGTETVDATTRGVSLARNTLAKSCMLLAEAEIASADVAMSQFYPPKHQVGMFLFEMAVLSE